MIEITRRMSNFPTSKSQLIVVKRSARSRLYEPAKSVEESVSSLNAKTRLRHEMTEIVRRNFIFSGLGVAALAASGQTVLAQTVQTGSAQLPTVTSANADGLKPSDLHCPPDLIKTGSNDVVLSSADGKLKTTTYIICKKKSP
jgi:hypothetical protein